MTCRTDAGRPGCRGALCRSAHALLRRLPVLRYPAGNDGLPDPDAPPLSGWVCALVGHSSASGGSSLDIPGVTGGQRTVRLTIAAGSLEPPVLSGDRIAVDGHALAVLSADCAGITTAELIPFPTEAE